MAEMRVVIGPGGSNGKQFRARLLDATGCELFAFTDPDVEHTYERAIRCFGSLGVQAAEAHKAAKAKV